MMMPNEPLPSLLAQAETAATLLRSSAWRTRNTAVHSHLDVSHDAIPYHPLGVKPSGNGLIAEWTLRTAAGNLATLPDELILLLLEYLDCFSLLRLGAACKALYAFTRSEGLWKRLFIL